MKTNNNNDFLKTEHYSKINSGKGLKKCFRKGNLL